MKAPLSQLFSGEHLSEFGLSVAADGEITHLSREAREHLANCPRCELESAARALEMLELPPEALANAALPPLQRSPSRALVRPIFAALAIGGLGLGLRVATLDRAALREAARALRTFAHAAPSGQPLLSLFVAVCATTLAIAIIRRLPAPQESR
jgi:hypothetical protein